MRKAPGKKSAAATSGEALATAEGPAIAGAAPPYVPTGNLVVDFFNRFCRRSDILFALALVTILVVLVLPMPAWMLDIGLATSMTFSVMVLMTVLFIERPLDFSTFPTVLLIATLLRLSLNMASVRLILGHGNEGSGAAGQVIQAFASFVMSGNFIIGIIVFMILTIVNFVVITKGSGRIAEVSARFTLDAMPGKQMAIDADLSSGLINEGEARRRRSELEYESNFFGSMDGAAKFVRGDAVAGLVITSINAVGGIIIGMLQKDMSFMQAGDAFLRLTVGDGLITQIPALIVSVAAGLLVTKTGEKNISTDAVLVRQLGNHPTAIGLCSFLMGAMALLPGLPFVPFAALSGLTGYITWQMHTQRAKKSAQELAVIAQKKTPVADEPIATALTMDLIRLELGYGLLQLINSEAGVKLTDQIKGLRRQMAAEMGFVMPAVRIQDNLQLPPNAYVIKIKEIEGGRGEIKVNGLLIMDPRGEKITLPGEATTEPAFGLPAMWIEPSYREEAMFKGYTVVDPPTIITTHLTEIVKDNVAELLSYAETQKLLDEMGKDSQKLVADIIPSQITMGGLQRILQNLLMERISIRDLSTILEGIAEASMHTRNLKNMTELVRGRLARQICDANTNNSGFIPLLTLSPEWEQAFAESLSGEGEEKQLAMAPSQLQKFISSLRQAYEKQAQNGESPVLLTTPTIRPYVRSIVERFRPLTVVMSQNEIHPKAKIKTLGQI